MSKGRIILLLLAVLTADQAPAQDLNSQLRRLFSMVQFAPEPAPFLFERSAHEIDDNWFTPINEQDTADPNIWWTIYHEMRYAALDTGLLPETFALRQGVIDLVRKDTIPIGVLDLEFNRLRVDAFDSGVYFGWTDSVLHDIPAPPGKHPYALNLSNPQRGTRFDVFCAVPLTDRSKFQNVTFVLDSGFIFYGKQYNSSTRPSPEHTVSINFNDGSGWHTVDPGRRTLLDIHYPGHGLYKTEVKVEHDGLIRYTQSLFVVEENAVSIQPHEVVDHITGIKAGIYYSCDGTRVLNKVLIAVSGFDAFEAQTIPRIYEQLINEPKLIMLRNYGYDIVCVDWDDSKADLTENGDRLIRLIEYLKCKVLDVRHNFTIVGISMGALITNYALTKMESQDYILSTLRDSGICYPDQMHNTRTFLSLEGEYQGAFINVGAQRFTELLKNERHVHCLPSFTISSMRVDAAYMRDQVLSRKGIRQMLKFHIDSTDGQGNYFPHAERIAFLDLMHKMGGSPSYVKIIALSSALANGRNQVALGNRLALEGEPYYSLVFSFRLRILGRLKLPVEFHTNLHSYPGPSAGEQLVLQYYLRYPRTLNISGCLRKILTLGLCQKCPCVLFHKTQEDFKLRSDVSWDVTCGSRVSTATAVFGTGEESIHTLGGISRIHPAGYLSYALLAEPATGKASATAVYSLGGYIKPGTVKPIPVMLPLLEANLDILAGLESFSFVPWMSAYNYTDYDSVNQDLNGTATKKIMAHVPFDVLMGRNVHPDFPLSLPVPNAGQKHFEHRDIRADPDPEDPDLTILTREIGEVHQFLDNITVNRRSTFEAEKTIFAGAGANAKYKTPGTSGWNTYPAVWSARAGFQVIRGGHADLQAGSRIILMPGFTVRDGGSVTASIRRMTVCQFSLKELRERDQLRPDTLVGKSVTVLLEPSDVVAYPNPFRSWLTIDSRVEGAYGLYSISGQLLTKGQLTEGKTSVDADQLSRGVYILHVHNASWSGTVRLVKNE